MDKPEPKRRDWFTTTRWSLVLAAADEKSPQAREALEDLCERYWQPLYVYARRRGHGPEEAQDLTQGFFVQFLSKGYVGAADPLRGRFRSFLLASLKNYMANQWDRASARKRGGGSTHVYLDSEKGESLDNLKAAEDVSPERVYELQWALTLVDQTLARLAKEMDKSGRRKRFEALRPFLTGEASGVRYRSVGASLDMKEGAIKVAVHRMRRRFGVLLRQEVGQTVSDPEEIDKEIRHLLSVL